jgi:transposase
MKLNNISINSAVQEAENLIKKDKSLSPAIKATIKMLILVISLLSNRLNLNSKNSSKPPSEDENRKRGSTKKKSDKKQGGQNGHIGTKLKKISDPDRIEEIKIDRRILPKGVTYKKVGYESRQEFDIEISRVVTEYRAEILEDENGKRYTAEFPANIKSETQYGAGVKSSASYMSQYQLLPYQRIKEQFADQMKLPLSTGSLYNFNKEAYDRLEQFEEIVKQKLINSSLVHADETGINVDKKRLWLHSASNDKWTHYFPHTKRGSEAMDEIGIIPNFNGVLCHDHWKPYYKYNCTHALCNAHHLRELTNIEEQENHVWAKEVREFLLEVNKAVDNACGKMIPDKAEQYRVRYRAILKKAEETECLLPEKTIEKGKHGRIKKTKARNLLERLIKFENDVLRFMETDFVPFTNNQGESDLRMTKVQQKISGCFRSIDGAYIFCRVRSYLSTCLKNDVSATEALRLLFIGKLPDFVYDS